MKLPSTCDIFCTVIDNYGDIGVCWRLARQLASEHGVAVRLWVDDLQALQRLWPATNIDRERQRIAGVAVCKWQEPFVAVEPADIAIEAFACELPASYIQSLAQRAHKSLWINLEYLSAEGWVAACHGLPSPQSAQPSPRALEKYFFFPGFSDRTGGLLRERELLSRRHEFQRDPAARVEFLARFGVATTPAVRTVSLFAYENAALSPLLEAWVNASQPILCLVPAGKSLADIGRFFDQPHSEGLGSAGLSSGGPDPAVGSIYQRGALTLAVLPFLSQDDYDLLLWSCDLNFVRGEDSFVRAQWAGRPLIWHIYPQRDDAHQPKLNAFLELYRADLAAPAAAATTACWQAWNDGGDMAGAWRELEVFLPILSAHAESWCERLSARENLAAALVQFCANHV
ncbi:MAG TPA: elongation factor P maturation arginine rhamnosyltransferase EarP [Spongiibacteraceae bacterium]|nr:elongation factor P maturation arginine rhamnosyltransferase EarP [Spongiibacteraceae bacterium]